MSMQQSAANKNNGYFQIDFSQIMERKDSPIISRQRASFVLSKLGESPTKESAVKSVPIEVKKEWLRPGYTLERAIYDKVVMASFREYLISIQARESLAFWLETAIYRTLTANQQQRRAREIYDKYFKKGCEYELAIEGLDITTLEANIERGANESTFAECQNEVWTVLCIQCFPRFKKSPYWESLISGVDASTSITNKSRRRNTLGHLDKYLNRKAGSGRMMLSPREAELGAEDLLYHRNMFVDFTNHFKGTDCVLFFSFWLAAEIYRAKADADLASEAQRIWSKYFAAEPKLIPPHVEHLAFLREVQTRPSKQTYVLAQNNCWRNIKLKFFPLYIETSTFVEFLSGAKAESLHPEVLDVYDKYVSFRNNALADDIERRDAIAVVEKKLLECKIKRDIVTMRDIMFDRRFCPALRDFLHKCYADELLSFYIDAELYEVYEGEARVQHLAMMQGKFFDKSSDCYLDLAHNLTSEDFSATKADLFVGLKEEVFKTIKEQYLNNFLATDEFKQLHLVLHKQPTLTRNGTVARLEELRRWNQSDDNSQAESASESKESVAVATTSVAENNTNELPANNN